MAKPNKTQVTQASVEEFVKALPEPARREDAQAIVGLLTDATGHSPHMYGSSIIGFGTYRYGYASGREGEAPLVGFAPRKTHHVFYVAAEEDSRADLLSRLGKHSTDKGCIYVKRLSDVDPKVLAEMARVSVETLKARYPG